jgi:membrane protein insertase Oxa1/YidC/SpoIIIJ
MSDRHWSEGLPFLQTAPLLITPCHLGRIFTFMLASFPAGLVIYWAWNNTMSVIQQSVIMRKHGAKIELFDNIKAVFGGGRKGRSAQ